MKLHGLDVRQMLLQFVAPGRFMGAQAAIQRENRLYLVKCSTYHTMYCDNRTPESQVPCQERYAEF